MDENSKVTRVGEKEKEQKTVKKAEASTVSKMNIFQKMSAVTAELQTVGKNMEVGTGNNKYKAVSERDILDAVKPIEEKYGVYSYPCNREVLESNLLESESNYNGQITKKTTFMTRIMTVYRFVNVDNPTEFIEMTTFSEGIDAQDKGSGKAMTYGDKYALMKAYKISTGDDPDATASEDTDYKPATQAKAPQRVWGGAKNDDTAKKTATTSNAPAPTANSATPAPTGTWGKGNTNATPAPTGTWGKGNTNATTNVTPAPTANSAPTGRWSSRKAQ